MRRGQPRGDPESPAAQIIGVYAKIWGIEAYPMNGDAV